ncbi:hypothetical protein ASA01S_085_00060 [Aeromonas salmonicida subsp. masoucida NBRC 13784]|nr:hypothetical protein ASA01S_085_00060 [Aeromonas salmonicida subsp. masoucida NBRC 13784]
MNANILWTANEGAKTVLYQVWSIHLLGRQLNHFHKKQGAQGPLFHDCCDYFTNSGAKKRAV